jgi:hypothetical protein
MTSLSERLTADLRPFADPGSTIVHNGDRFSWVKKRRDLELRVIYSGSSPQFVFEDAELSYKQLFAALADLDHLAEMIETNSTPEANYVGGRVETDAAEGGSRQLSAERLLELGTGDEDRGRTGLVLLRGRAGAGKSVLLRHLRYPLIS